MKIGLRSPAALGTAALALLLTACGGSVGGEDTESSERTLTLCRGVLRAPAAAVMYGMWYLVLLGGIAVVAVLALPRGLWGLLSGGGRLHLFPVGYHVSAPKS